MTGFKQKKILVINANSSCSVTKGLKDELSAPTKLFNVAIEYTQIDGAPKAIETKEDVELSHKLTIAFVKKAKADAFVIACFGDPGIIELRDQGYQNVFGIGESAMHMAANMGGKFGILSISSLSIKRHEEQVARAGLSSMLAGDLPIGLGVLELKIIEKTRPRMEKMARRLKEHYGAKSIILGCAGMGLHRAWLQDLLNIPVIEPCWAGVTMAVASLGTSDSIDA